MLKKSFCSVCKQKDLPSGLSGSGLGQELKRTKSKVNRSVRIGKLLNQSVDLEKNCSKCSSIFKKSGIRKTQQLVQRCRKHTQNHLIHSVRQNYRFRHMPQKQKRRKKNTKNLS